MMQKSDDELNANDDRQCCQHHGSAGCRHIHSHALQPAINAKTCARYQHQHTADAIKAANIEIMQQILIGIALEKPDGMLDSELR